MKLGLIPSLAAPLLAVAAFPYRAAAAASQEPAALAPFALLLEEVQASGKSLDSFIRDAKSLLKEPAEDAAKREASEHEKTVQQAIDSCLTADLKEGVLFLDDRRLMENAVCEGFVKNSPAPCAPLQPPPPSTPKGEPEKPPTLPQRSPATLCREMFYASRLARAVIVGDPGANEACAAYARDHEFTPNDAGAFCGLLLGGADPGPACGRLSTASDSLEGWDSPNRTQECVETILLFRGAAPCAVTKWRNPSKTAMCSTVERFKKAFKLKNADACGEDVVCRAMVSPEAKHCDYVRKQRAEFCRNESTRLLGEARDKKARLLASPNDPAVAMKQTIGVMLPHIKAALAGSEGITLNQKEQEDQDALRQGVLGKKGGMSRSSILALIMRVHENNFRTRASRLEALLNDYKPAFEAQALRKKLFEIRQNREAAIKEFWAAPKAKPSAPK